MRPQCVVGLSNVTEAKELQTQLQHVMVLLLYNTLLNIYYNIKINIMKLPDIIFWFSVVVGLNIAVDPKELSKHVEHVIAAMLY